MTTGISPNPYETPDAAVLDTDASGNVLEIELTVSEQPVNMGGGILAIAETINEEIPAPTLRLSVGDTVIVRLINDLPHPAGIHWHGIELGNSADGTPVTQDGVAAGPFPAPVPWSPTGGTYLYKFKAPRPGLYWYHPHHHHSTNRVFRGTYGMIIVTDPNEAALIASGTLPVAADTKQLVLSDTTVCKAVLSNDDATYVDPTDPILFPDPDDAAEWLSGSTSQPGPTPEDLCELSPMNEDGTAGAPFAAGDIPNIQRGPAGGRTNEGQTVLTNGVNVGGRLGTPASPRALVGASTYDVQPGQGLRLQIVNSATIRYFRLILTTDGGVQVPLVRVGGEGGLLDNAVVEGGIIGGFDFKYSSGEILIPPASRVDVVAAIPDSATGTLTLWTRDFQRVGAGAGWSELPTVPVMHLNVTGAVVSPAYTIADGTPLRAAIPAPVEALGAATGVLLDPSTFSPAKIGQVVTVDTPDIQDIQLTIPPSINGTTGSFSGFTPYTNAPHILSSRYAEQGEILELTVTNTSLAHHPFHLHGFSFQPISLTQTGQPTFTWPYNEFRDNLDVPSGYTLTFRVRLDDRELDDGVTLGGALGRWLFHCHIFFHAHLGMLSELVTTAADGSEKPNVDVGGSWAYTPLLGTAKRKGTFSHPDGDAVTLTATLANGTPRGTVTDVGGGRWEWKLDTSVAPDPASVEYVYITATDSSGRKDQTVFRLKIGAPDDGSDTGDPHITTVDGKRYDFQAVGEFTLLRDREGMEIQTRQTPVLTANPITDSYSGLTSCVSVNTAVAARVGSHRISYQPSEKGGDSRLQFFVDGKLRQLSTEGIDLDGHRVSAFDADGEIGLRVDYEHHAVLTVSPRFWNKNNIWYMNVSVSHTQADEGLMGSIPKSSWLPTLRGGATVGPKPEALGDRYIALYRTFANSWRVTDDTSLFVYAPGTSTGTFTDEDWPAEKPPCKMKPQFVIPGLATPVNIPVNQAEQICAAVTEEDLHANCVFDVATTGDESFAKDYLLVQDLRLHGSAVQIVGDKDRTLIGEALVVTAIVLPISSKCKSTPTGSVTFLVDGVAAGPPVKLDKQGRARLTLDRLDAGEHKIRAAYAGGRGKYSYHSSSSPNLLHTVAPPVRGATLRRVLRFFNAARSPEDLVAAPRRQVPLIDERQGHGIHLDEDQAEHGGHGQRPALVDRHLAKHVLAERDKKNPLYGFARLQDLQDIARLKLELYHHIFPLFSPGVYGEWEVLYGGAGTPFDVAHAALLHNGQVLFIPESFTATDTLLWDPEDPSHATALRTLSSATTGLTGVLFCGAHCFLQDGKLLVVGGGTSSSGTAEAWKFDPTTETWQLTAGPMAVARWYPTTVILGEDSGRVLVADGRHASMEIYSESSDSFEPVHGPAGPGDTSADRDFPRLYPGLHLLPTGEIFFTRTGNNTGTDPAAYFTFLTPTSGSWTGLTGGSAGDDRGRGMSLMLLRQQPTDPDRILVIGGGDATTQATVGLIDNPPSSAAWLTGSFPDGLARRSVHGVLLPDGKVLVCGGRPAGGSPSNGGVCYLYDPSAGVGLGAFSEMDEVAYARQYHSVAILLPSGKVMITGGSSETIEVFSPPYLFTALGTPASRPVIDSYPDPAGGAIILHGSTFEIGTAQAADIDKVVLVRPMAVTHQTDAEQRVLSLTSSLRDPTTLSVTAPDGRIYPYAGGGGHTHVTAARGYYMLFILNSSGVPSEAKFVRLV